MSAHIIRHAVFAALALVATLCAAPAHAANCDGDRKLYPKDWASIDKETPLFTCGARYIRLRVFLTPRSDTSAMLTVATDKSVYRAIVDARDVASLKQQAGLYILNSEKTCFIRGNYSAPAVLSFAEASSRSTSFFFAANSLDLIERCEAAK